MKSTALETIEVHEGEVVNAPLSDEERAGHIERVERILTAFQYIAHKSLEVWSDLKWIKDNHTYREKYDTFNDFCRDELGKDNSQIYRYIKDAEFKEALLLEAVNDTERSSIMSLKESNTRFIRKLPLEVQIPFWKLTYGIGLNILPKKEDGSIEVTTGFLESVGGRLEEVMETGGINLDGEFVPLDRLQQAAEVAGTDEETAKAILLSLGVSEEYFELLERQKQHIQERSAKADVHSLKGTISTGEDVNGSSYPILIDSKGNEVDLSELLLAFNNRFIHLSIRAPIRD
jgi:hypothetical protein